MLSGILIHQGVLNGSIVIRPFVKERLNPNSYNLTLGNKLLTYRNHYLDCKKNNPTVEIEIPDSGFILHPGKIYLGSTVEWTETPMHIPAIEGRSSIGRLGLDIHATAGFGDVGFKGIWTLELSVKQPLTIYRGMEVCQICYHLIEGPFKSYDGKYQGQVVVEPSQIYRELVAQGEKLEGVQGAD